MNIRKGYRSIRLELRIYEFRFTNSANSRLEGKENYQISTRCHVLEPLGKGKQKYTSLFFGRSRSNDCPFLLRGGVLITPKPLPRMEEAFHSLQGLILHLRILRWEQHFDQLFGITAELDIVHFNDLIGCFRPYNQLCNLLTTAYRMF